MFPSPCSGLILTVASKMDVKDTIVDTYLNNRMDDYRKYKKMIPSEKQIVLKNRDYDYKG